MDVATLTFLGDSVLLTLRIFPSSLSQQLPCIRSSCTTQVLTPHFDWTLGTHMAEGKTIKIKWVILIRQQSSESHTHFKGVGGLLSQPWKAVEESKTGREMRNWSFRKVQVRRSLGYAEKG